MEREAGYYWVKYVGRNDWSIEYWNGRMWFTRNPTLIDDNWFSTIDETPIVRGQKETNEQSNCNIPHVVGQSEQLKAFQNLPSETKDYQNTKHGLVWKNK